MDANTFVSRQTSDWNKLALAVAHGRSVKEYMEAPYEDAMGREAEERTLLEENIRGLYGFI